MPQVGTRRLLIRKFVLQMQIRILPLYSRWQRWRYYFLAGFHERCCPGYLLQQVKQHRYNSMVRGFRRPFFN